MKKSIFAQKTSAFLIAAFAMIDKAMAKKPQQVVVFKETNLSPAEFGRIMKSIQHDDTKTVQVPNGKQWSVYTTCERVAQHLVLTQKLDYETVTQLPDEIAELFQRHRADTSTPYGGEFKTSLAFCY